MPSPLKIGDHVCCTYLDPEARYAHAPGTTGVIVGIRPDWCLRSLDVLDVRADGTGAVFECAAYEVTRVDQVADLVRSLMPSVVGSDER